MTGPLAEKSKYRNLDSAQFATPYTRSTTPASKISSIKEHSSPDLSQRLERKLAEYNASENILKRWLFEIGSWLLSAACMSAIVGIYLHISEKEMVRSDRLLTLVNILGKVASAALIVPVSEAVGQLKWNWFHDSQTLWDFEIFDKASRGPWGATLLLFRTKGRSLAGLGALLIVLLLAIDTFFQQVVSFPDQWTLHDTPGEIPRLLRYDPMFQMDFWRGFEVNMYDLNLKPIIHQYFYGNGTQPVAFGNGTRPEVPLSCPTSNCTWPVYETLAFCSKCTDVSDHLNSTFTCMNSTIDWSADWPGPLDEVPYPTGTVCGHWLNATSEHPILLSGYRVNDTESDSTNGETLLVRTLPLTTFLTKVRTYNVGSIAFEDTRNAIYDTLIASASDGVQSVYEGLPPVLTECVLLWCVQTIESSYALGRYSETILSSVHNTTAGPSPWDSWDVPEEEGGGTYTVYKENVTIEIPTPSSTHQDPTMAKTIYGTGNGTTSNIMLIFDDFFPSMYTISNLSATPRMIYKYYKDGPSVRGLPFSPLQAPNDLSHHLQRMAISLTNGIRSSVSKQMLTGEAYYVEKFVLVRWAWLTFPLLLLLLSLVFLVSTIVKTSKDATSRTWRLSSMPTLWHNLPKGTNPDFSTTYKRNQGSHRPTNEMETKIGPPPGWI